jgi:transposase
MAYVQIGEDFLPNKTVNELVNLYRKEKNSKASIRLLFAINRKNGKTIPDIAKVLFIPTSTISDHLKRISKDFNKLYDRRIQQRPPRLTVKEHKQLIDTIKNPPTQCGYPAIIWTTKMILHYIQDNFNKNFTLHGLRKLLYRASFVRLKPRPYHAKGNKEEQKKFKKNYPKSLINICKMDMRSFFWMNQDSF